MPFKIFFYVTETSKARILEMVEWYKKPIPSVYRKNNINEMKENILAKYFKCMYNREKVYLHFTEGLWNQLEKNTSHLKLAKVLFVYLQLTNGHRKKIFGVSGMKRNLSKMMNEIPFSILKVCTDEDPWCLDCYLNFE